MLTHLVTLGEFYSSELKQIENMGLARVLAKDINFRLAKHHYPLNMGLFQENRIRLCERLKRETGVTDGLIFLQGGSNMQIHAIDTHPPFRQESFFHWAFGVQE